jgi:alpha-L-rhamnosidase
MIVVNVNSTRKLAGVILLMFSLIEANVWGQSIAHDKSKFAVIDPSYRSDDKRPLSTINASAASWIYGPAELECWRLRLLMQRKDSAKLRVGYPGNYHIPGNSASFRLNSAGEVKLDSLRFRAVGHGKIFINNHFFADFNETDLLHSLPLAADIGVKEIQFDVISSNELPALLIEDEYITTRIKLWEWKSPTQDWQGASPFPQNLQGVPPHRLEDPTMILQPVSVENRLYDFGCELYGYVEIRNTRKPKILAGESRAEAMDTLNTVLEQSSEMVQAENGYWISRFPLAFRYLYVVDKQIDTVQCKAVFYPLAYRGAFACSDSTLTRIWMNSAYTLRLCMHDFMLDGIKRDRLPWTGDLAMSMVCNAYAFNDSEMVRRSLVALGRAGIKEKDINGIIDYSLWWIIAQDHYQLYFGDAAHLKTEWVRIQETLLSLSARCDPSGFIIPAKSWLFIDWVDQKKWTALQILWWWAQESGARLAHRMGDMETEKQLKNSSISLRNNLIKCAWSENSQCWLPDSDALSAPTRHPNFLAVISGLAKNDQWEGIKKILENDEVSQVGTPYMAGFENMALSRLGNIQLMLNRIKDYWGGMLERGATTFWEAYNPKQIDNQQYSFYGRPYAKSLCHAWSSGPAAFLPSGIIGLIPLEDGWKRFAVNPNLGQLNWASVTVSTKFGDIRVDIEKEKITINVPSGTTLDWDGKSIQGPAIVKDNASSN